MAAGRRHRRARKPGPGDRRVGIHAADHPGGQGLGRDVQRRDRSYYHDDLEPQSAVLRAVCS